MHLDTNLLIMCFDTLLDFSSRVSFADLRSKISVLASKSELGQKSDRIFAVNYLRNPYFDSLFNVFSFGILMLINLFLAWGGGGFVRETRHSRSLLIAISEENETVLGVRLKVQCPSSESALLHFICRSEFSFVEFPQLKLVVDKMVLLPPHLCERRVTAPTGTSASAPLDCPYIM